MFCTSPEFSFFFFFFLLRLNNHQAGVSSIKAKKNHLLPITTPFLNPRKTNLSRIVFGIAASANLWKIRREYVRSWWHPRKKMRGFVWLDEPVKNMSWGSDVPPFMISESTKAFEYSNRIGNRSAIRLSRIVIESIRLRLQDVDWFVMGDDDTVFFTENLVRVLSNYDPTKMYYIGSQSESHPQNTDFSYNMAYGGGGFAISYPLALALSKFQDSCLHRYPQLFGSDDRMHACITELGVPILKNPGFHQFDVYGDAFGLLAVHPLVPLLSIHHLDIIKPIFHNMTRVQAVRHLLKVASVDQAAMLQQTICYGQRQRWSFSISLGYAVQVYQGFISPWELQRVPRTFLSWHGNKARSHFPFNIQEISVDSCKQPTIFYMRSVHRLQNKTTARGGGSIETVYKKEDQPERNMTGCDTVLSSVQVIRIRKKPTLETLSQRLCCKVQHWRSRSIDIDVQPCGDGELAIDS
ncbi:unnamed protein product [Sphagnum compactum]